MSHASKNNEVKKGHRKGCVLSKWPHRWRLCVEIPVDSTHNAYALGSRLGLCQTRAQVLEDPIFERRSAARLLWFIYGLRDAPIELVSFVPLGDARRDDRD
jgi:hypothetical protein